MLPEMDVRAPAYFHAAKFIINILHSTKRFCLRITFQLCSNKSSDWTRNNFKTNNIEVKRLHYKFFCDVKTHVVLHLCHTSIRLRYFCRKITNIDFLFTMLINSSHWLHISLILVIYLVQNIHFYIMTLNFLIEGISHLWYWKYIMLINLVGLGN